MRKNLLLLSLITFWSVQSFGQYSKYLDIDTYFYPQGKYTGMNSDKVKFRAGKKVFLNSKGDVISGVLAEDRYFYPQGLTTPFNSDRVLFRNGTKITFNAVGEVTSGSLAYDKGFYPSGLTSPFNSDKILFMAGEPISFNLKGEVTSGTLVESKGFYIQGLTTPFNSDRVLFKAGYKVIFNLKGEVIKGTLAIDKSLYPQGKTTAFNSDKVNFKGGCCVSFNVKGEVIVGTLAEEKSLPSANPEKVKYTSGTKVTFSNTGEVTAFTENSCECIQSKGSVPLLREFERLDKILTDQVSSYDKTVLTVLKRNKWENSLVVADVTENMYQYDAQVYLYFKQNFSKPGMKYFVFFNDGDGKPDDEKVIGNTEGIYGINNSNISDMLSLMKSTMENGDGGDAPDNDMEAILFGMNKCPDCSNIIYICDNNSTPRDLALLNKITKPLKVIPCNLNGIINPALLNIAYKTKGSVHTLDEDITTLPSMKTGEIILIGGHTYKLASDGFVTIK